VLDLARVAGPRAVPIRGLVAIGELFGISGNALRVAVARLLAAGLLESDERGSYRLGAVADPVSRHVEGWRLGDRRRRSWDGGWIAVALGRADRGERAASLRALERAGLREGLAGLWVRPDNLAEPLERSRERLGGLGLERGACCFVASALPGETDARWRELWPRAELLAEYRDGRARLERSSSRLERLPVERAAVEAFLLGGAAIRVLALDPLLPDELLDPAPRRELWEAMLRYDTAGRRVWARLLDGVRLGAAPADSSDVRRGVPEAGIARGSA
jgi:phenylacetic acid degradation operon negative regulatory protein